ncbi:MAG: NUDIX hydrolase [Treponema sp.]|nr:NUDIX hydrolase [Treponema sp.]
MKSYFTEDDEKLKWKTNSTKKLLSTVVFDVTEQENQASNGLTGKYIITECPDWVITIPVHNEKIIMVKQWRHGEKALSVEFPGGVIDKNELPEKAAARELSEETGFKAGKLTKLGSVNPNPALFSNHVHVFLAEDLIQTGEQDLDSDEFINCMELSLEEVLEGMGTPEFPHAIMGTALAFYLKYLKLGKN